MKKQSLTKVLLVLLGTMLALVGCQDGSGSNSQATEAEDKTFKIGVIQLAEHVALDRTREGFEERLAEEGIEAEIIYENAQGELPTVMNITEKFIQEEVDLIYAIATPAAQGVMNAVSGTDIPVIFNAVTDPEDAGLVESNEAPGGQVTGVSDFIASGDQVKAFVEVFPEIETLGVLYSTNEANSAKQVEDLEKTCQDLGLDLVVKGIHNINDASSAMTSMASQIDGYFAITDNMVSSSAAAIAKILNDNMIPSYAAEEGPVENGLLMSDGVSYKELGKLAGGQAKEILLEGKSPAEIPVEFAIETNRVVNQDTMEVLGLEASLFGEADLVGTSGE